MSSSTEDLVRQAFERQAELAVDPDRIRAELPARAARRARTRRYGVLTTFAVAVAAIAAVAVPVVVVRGGLGDPAQSGAPATLAEIPLRYRVTWLPPGLTERSRSGSVGGRAESGDEILRSWSPESAADGDAQLFLTVQRAPRGAEPAATPMPDLGTPVDINGRPGHYTDGGNKSVLDWSPDTETVIAVGQQGLHLSQQDLERVARSVQPDRTVLESPVQIGWVPGGITLQRLTISGTSASSWQVGVTGEQQVPRGEKGEQRFVEVSYGTTAGTPEDGQSMTVNGRRAWYVAGAADEMSYLVVDLGQGRFLTVAGSGSQHAPISKGDLVRIAQHTEVDPEPDMSWIGVR